jgi:hypothetical protein
VGWWSRGSEGGASPVQNAQPQRSAQSSVTTPGLKQHWEMCRSTASSDGKTRVQNAQLHQVRMHGEWLSAVHSPRVQHAQCGCAELPRAGAPAPFALGFLQPCVAREVMRDRQGAKPARKRGDTFSDVRKGLREPHHPFLWRRAILHSNVSRSASGVHASAPLVSCREDKGGNRGHLHLVIGKRAWRCTGRRSLCPTSAGVGECTGGVSEVGTAGGPKIAALSASSASRVLLGRA